VKTVTTTILDMAAVLTTLGANATLAGVAPTLDDRLARLGVRDEDLEESFVHASGKGGQNVNKVATCVVLRHRPTGLAVKCQRERAQAANRVIAREMLADKIEAQRRARENARRAQAEKARRQARTRPKGVKRRMVEGKRARAAKKALRGRVRGDE
jgi:protein subunit release factor B